MPHKPPITGHNYHNQAEGEANTRYNLRYHAQSALPQHPVRGTPPENMKFVRKLSVLEKAAELARASFVGT